MFVGSTQEILLHHIAWEIDDYHTWYNFALVSKKCSRAARYFTKPKKREFSQSRVVDKVQFHVLPNGWIHGPLVSDWQIGYYTDGYASQTAIWHNKLSHHYQLIRETLTGHMFIIEQAQQISFLQITPEQTYGRRIVGLKCPNCGWMHIVYTWTINAGVIKNVFLMVQRCSDKNYQRLVFRNIDTNVSKWRHFHRYYRKHPTGFRFQDIPVYFQK